MNWLAASIAYVATLVFIAYLIWLWRFTTGSAGQIEELRKEVNALAMSIGLKRANMGGPGMLPRPPTIG